MDHFLKVVGIVALALAGATIVAHLAVDYLIDHGKNPFQ